MGVTDGFKGLDLIEGQNHGWRVITLVRKVKVKSLSRVWLFDPMDCSPPGSSAHGIFQARVLERVATSFSRRSSRPRDWTWVSRIVGRCFTLWATREVPNWSGGRDQIYTREKEMQEGKVVVWGGFTKSWRKKRSKRQGGQGKIYPTEGRIPENSEERQGLLILIMQSNREKAIEWERLEMPLRYWW